MLNWNIKPVAEWHVYIFYGGIFFSSDFFYSLKSASEWCNYFQEKENNWVEREIIIGAEKGFKKVDILCVGIYFCWSLLRELKTTKHLYVTLNLNCVLTSFNLVFLAMKKSLKWIGNFRGNSCVGGYSNQFFRHDEAIYYKTTN